MTTRRILAENRREISIAVKIRTQVLCRRCRGYEVACCDCSADDIKSVTVTYSSRDCGVSVDGQLLPADLAVVNEIVQAMTRAKRYNALKELAACPRGERE